MRPKRTDPCRPGGRRLLGSLRAAPRTVAITLVLFAVSLRAEPAVATRPLAGPDWMWEGILPGYSLFRQKRPVAGTLIATGRVVSLAGFFYFQRNYARYASAQTAARNADLYYGPGLRYKDPYSGSYRSTGEFRHEADRNLNLSLYAAGFHLILLATGVFNGIQNELRYREEEAPVFEAASPPEATIHDPILRPSPGQDIFRIVTPLDF